MVDPAKSRRSAPAIHWTKGRQIFEEKFFMVEAGGGGGVGTCGVREGCEEIFPVGGIRRGGPDRNIGKGYQC